jgi:hypothetical protein
MRLFRLTCVLATAGLLAGCGSGASSTPTAKATAEAPTATPTPAKTASPALRSASDQTACAQLEQTIQAVSLVVGHTTEEITQALHPKELAQKISQARHSLLDSAKVIEIVQAPPELAGSQRNLARGLRAFAADFERGRAATAKGDMAKAAELMVDEGALRKIQTSAKRIDDLCGD